MESEAQATRLPVCAVPFKHASGSIMETFERIVTDGARANILRDGYLTPVAAMLGIDLKGEGYCAYFVILGNYMNSTGGKDLLAKALPQLAEKMGAFAFSMVSEAWALTCDGQSEADRIYEEYGSLGEHPDAVEVVNITIETRHGNAMRTYPIERDADGAVTGLGENMHKDLPGPGTVAGRFANFLKPLPGGLN
jgi:hypothetical protein